MLFGLSSSFGLILIMKIEFKCQNAIFMPNSNVKIEFFLSKYNIHPQFESQNWNLNGE